MKAREKLEEAGQRRKPADVGPVPRAAGLGPERLGVAAAQGIEQGPIVGLGLGEERRGRPVMSEFGADMGEVDARHDHGIGAGL